MSFTCMYIVQRLHAASVALAVTYFALSAQFHHQHNLPLYIGSQWRLHIRLKIKLLARSSCLHRWVGGNNLFPAVKYILPTAASAKSCIWRLVVNRTILVLLSLLYCTCFVHLRFPLRTHFIWLAFFPCVTGSLPLSSAQWAHWTEQCCITF